jgi:predicted DNA-binding protein (MmcQ/YjbR family)
MSMNIDDLRRLCLAFPGATEQVQWGSDLLFKVSGKMFAVTPLEPAPVWLSFKVTPEHFADLTERPGIIPAPYLARASWISIETPTILPGPEIAALLRESYDLVAAKLSRKTRAALGAPPSAGRAPAKPKRPKKTYKLSRKRGKK